MAKRKTYSPRKRTTTNQQAATAPRRTARNTPVKIAEKSKSIRKPRPPAKRRPNAKAKEVKNERKKIVVKQHLASTSTRTDTRSHSQQSTPDIKIERPESPSVFANCTQASIYQPFLSNHVPMPKIIVNNTQPSHASETIHSQTISSTMTGKQATTFYGTTSAFGDSQATNYSQAVESRDNYLDFILSDTKTQSKNTVDCGVQCTIRAQCDVATNTPPIGSDFDMLDVTFLNRMAARLGISRATVQQTSRDIFAEMKDDHGIQLSDEDDAIAVEVDRSSPSTFSLGMLDSFDVFGDGYSNGEDEDSYSIDGSIVSGSPPTDEQYFI